MSPTETFNAIQRVTQELVAAQYALWNNELVPLLAKNRIRVHDAAKLNGKASGMGAKIFPRGSFSDAHSAGGRRESSLSAAAESEPQFVCARGQKKRRRTAARDRPGAARLAAR